MAAFVPSVACAAVLWPDSPPEPVDPPEALLSPGEDEHPLPNVNASVTKTSGLLRTGKGDDNERKGIQGEYPGGSWTRTLATSVAPGQRGLSR